MNITNLCNKLSNKVVRDLQERILDRCYDFPVGTPARKRNSERYDETVAVLLTRLGPRNVVYEIDADLGQTFSDCFKDDNGCRPGSWAYEDAKAYMDRIYAAQAQR